MTNQTQTPLAPRSLRALSNKLAHATGRRAEAAALAALRDDVTRRLQAGERPEDVARDMEARLAALAG